MARSSSTLSLKSTWTGKLVLSEFGVPLLTCTWHKDHSEARINYLHVPEKWLSDLLARMPDDVLGNHLDQLQKCPWKDNLLADAALYGPLFTVRLPDAIRHTYYALGQLAARLSCHEIALALKYVLALDFEKVSPYFLDAFPENTSLVDMEGIPATLVLPLIVSCEALPTDERRGYVNLIQSFVGFFSQTGISTSDFLYDIINVLTRTEAAVSMPAIVYRLLSLARQENFNDLLKTVNLYEYLARLGHPIDLAPLTTWADLLAEIRSVTRHLAEQIGGTSDLAALGDKKVLDTFLALMPDYLKYTETDRWPDLQKNQLRECMRRYLQTGTVSGLKYPDEWCQSVERMLTRQLGSAAAQAFVARWMTPGIIYTYDYTADPALKKEEITRLEQLHAHVDLSTFTLPIPEKYAHLVSHPFTNTYYETKRALVASGQAVPPEPVFVLLDAPHHAKVMFYKEQAEVRYDPSKPDSVFIKAINGLFREAFLAILNRTPSEEEIHTLEDLREKMAHMILGLSPSRDIADLVEVVLERCHLDRRHTPIEVQEKLRRRFREALIQHRRQYKDFYDNIMQYKLFRYFHDFPERKALLEAVFDAGNYDDFGTARGRLLSTMDHEVKTNPLLAALVGDAEISYLRKLIYTYNFTRALKLFDFIVTKETRREDPKVHDLILNYAKLQAHIKASNHKSSSADARERLEAFIDLLDKSWDRFDRLLKHEGTNRALEYLAEGYHLTNDNRDYLIEVCRNYLSNESRRIYARIQLWDTDRFLDWMTVCRTVYEPHVAHQQSCMHPDKLHARTGKTEYLMGYIRSPWVKQLYLGSKDLFDPFDENNKIRCILFLTPAVIDGQELLTLNLQHPYPLNPTREAWRVLMEGCKRLSREFRLPLIFPNISAEELQHAAIQTRAKLFTHVESKAIHVLIPKGPHELQQRDDSELSILPPVRDHVFLGQTLQASMITSQYWVILPEGE